MNAESAAQVRDRLAAINGVDRVILDAGEGVALLICRPPVNRHHVEDEARAILDELGGDAFPVIEVTYRTDHLERSRVRFSELHRTVSSGTVRIDVELDWGDQSFTGTATGELGGPLELRTAAQATLAALATIAQNELDLRLAGVKQVRSFDAELIVVSLYAAEEPARKFVGAVVTGSDPLRSTATAVLSALNRLMGNYLNRP